MKLNWKPAVVSAELCLLFFLLYGGSNRLTSYRSHVGSFYFAWERHIPFVPLMILPYMSIDLFFVAAPFLARSDRELRTIATRMAAAIVISCACFLVFPLKFAFERAHVDGPLGLIFNNFRLLDLPFNQFPSLHIALLFVLLDAYYHHSGRMLRWILVVWFTLIGLSALLTYQHHMIDIIGGFALGVLCLHFIREEPLRQPFLPNRRVATYYAAAAILFGLLAFTWMPRTSILFSPALSLAIVAAGYLFVGPGIYRKEGGRHIWTTWLLLWPVLIGQRLSLAHYVRQCRPYDAIGQGLWIGRRLTSAEARQARDAGITAVVDLTCEFSEPCSFRQLPYLSLSILDLTAPTADQINEAITFIKLHDQTGIVYLHCKAGYSRTAAVAGAYLMSVGAVADIDHALLELRRCRPAIIVRPEAVAALRAFHMCRSSMIPAP